MRRAGIAGKSAGLLIVIALAAACSGSTAGKTTQPPATDRGADTTVADSTTSPTDAPTTTAAPLPTVDVPQPPAPAAISGTTPQEQAQSLVQSVGDPANPIGGWLAAYDALGIPVIGSGGAGVGTTGDDPVGPGFDMVWMLSDTATHSSGLPLSDVVRMYVDDDKQSDGVGELLLADLRAGATSTDPQVALFANFVAARSSPHRAWQRSARPGDDRSRRLRRCRHGATDLLGGPARHDCRRCGGKHVDHALPRPGGASAKDQACRHSLLRGRRRRRHDVLGQLLFQQDRVGPGAARHDVSAEGPHREAGRAQPAHPRRRQGQIGERAWPRRPT